MKKKSKRKKINNLSFSECRAILEKNDTQKNSEYYSHVLERFNSLLPKQQEPKQNKRE